MLAVFAKAPFFGVNLGSFSISGFENFYNELLSRFGGWVSVSES